MYHFFPRALWRRLGIVIGHEQGSVLFFGALLALALLVSGCAGRSLSQDEQQSMASAATAAPKLQPGDKISLRFHPLKSGAPGGSLIDIKKDDGTTMSLRGPAAY